MNQKIYKIILFGIVYWVLGVISPFAQIKLPKLISDGMVLQRNTETRIWGWASPSEDIKIQFLDKEYFTQADKDGRWELMLSDLNPGGPFQMTLKASNTIVIKNILIGDVWVCSGQSNMDLTMKRVGPLYPEEIKEAKNPNIRYFYVPQKYNFQEPQKDVEQGNWIEVNPDHIQNFSATAYFFAKHLYSKYKIPVGLLKSSLGGSPAQAWLSEDALKRFPEYHEEFKQYQNQEFVDSIIHSDQLRSKNWYTELNQKDLGLKGDSVNWKSPCLDDSNWEKMQIPGYWGDGKLGEVNGGIWFRKEIEVPASFLDKDVMLLLGRIVDADSVFINGKFVGTTGYQYPPRRYNVPNGILKEGKNTIAVRVISNIGKGGFIADKPYELVCGNEKIDIKGEWKYKLGVQMEALQPQTFVRWKPGGLYNAMISPLIPYSIKGAIWYQGEANTDHPQDYQALMSTLIKDWRAHWNQGEFPFLFVQLANYMEAKDKPESSNWAMLRDQQLKTLEVSNTGMAVIIDSGEWNDIHPLNKKTVGDRLGLAAQKIAYGDKDVVYSGPIYKSMKIKKNKVILSFTNIGSGLKVNGEGDLKEFAITGKDKNFIWAKAEIKGNKIIVWSDKVSEPVAVRYAWADNPDQANLYNQEGLPASPFRTDNWEK